eukprot:TRINITY_DN123085_c0_g1_i1.p1 TRINITY_DN123085_c0_g1~~TRINITY_DN123085_c0_g1_i1.p1  ORF type:complete len:388 (-),score=68.63 TRINITY_DN123085_c0_g1_i1:303-1466(-)
MKRPAGASSRSVAVKKKATAAKAKGTKAASSSSKGGFLKPPNARPLTPAQIVGGMAFITPWMNNAEIGQDGANRCIATAVAAGVKEFDVAPLYGSGSVEERFGRALKMLELEGKVSVMTKAGRLIRYADGSPCVDNFQDEGARPLSDRTVSNDYTAEGAKASLKDSLARMCVEKVNYLRIHDPNDNSCNRERAVDEVAIALGEEGMISEFVRMRKEGIVDKIGLGMNSNKQTHMGAPDQIIRLVEGCPRGTFNSALLAGGWNLLNQDGYECLEVCRQRGMEVHVAGVFASGLLVGVDRYSYSPAPQEMKDKAKQWGELAQKHGCDLPAVAIAFAYLPKVVTRVVLGITTKDEVIANMRAVAASNKVPRKLWKEARQLKLLDERLPIP